MAGPAVFEIEDGVLALAVVDKTVTGYADTWQAPGGKTALTAALADYDAAGTDWRCQVTKGALTASPSTTTKSIPATFCSPAEETPNPGVTTYALDLSFLQDPHLRAGLSSFLFQHDTVEAYFLLGLDGTNPPKAIGRLTLAAGNFGGDARSNLTSDLSLKLNRKPDIAFGQAGSTRLITGAGVVTNSGAAAARKAD